MQKRLKVFDKYDRLIIDVSNVYSRAYFSGQSLTAEIDGTPVITGGIYVTLKMLYKLRSTYLKEDGRIYYLFDNANTINERRKDIDPDYKTNRALKEVGYYRGLDLLNLVLQNLFDGDTICRKDTSEADDFVLPILESYSDINLTTLLVSNDFDWSRCISDKTYWLIRDSKIKKDVIITQESFKAQYGFMPTIEAVCLYKAIRGDVSDNIPVGVKGIKEETLIKLIEEVGSVPNLYKKLPELDLSDTWKTAILQNKGRVILNYRLVSFQALSQTEVKEYSTHTKYSKQALEMLYRTFKFDGAKLDDRLKPVVKRLSMFDMGHGVPKPRAEKRKT